MLHVGLTGGLGSGKSTVAAMLAGHGAVVVSSDDLARALMQPGQPVYLAIVSRFGSEVLQPDGALDRAALARIAFGQGRAEELNAIVHPPVIAEQAQTAEALAQTQPDAVLVVESALLFTTRHAGEGGWGGRFDRIVVVTAPEPLRVERFATRNPSTPTADLDELRAEARRRIAQQMPEAAMAARADFVLPNAGTCEQLQGQVDQLWAELSRQAHRPR